jgi:hypothetical protein
MTDDRRLIVWVGVSIDGYTSGPAKPMRGISYTASYSMNAVRQPCTRRLSSVQDQRASRSRK